MRTEHVLPCDPVMIKLLNQMEKLRYSWVTVDNTALKLCQIEKHIREQGVDHYSPAAGALYTEWFLGQGKWKSRTINYLKTLIRRLDQIFFDGTFSLGKNWHYDVGQYEKPITSFLHDCVIAGNSPGTIRWKRQICYTIASQLIEYQALSPAEITPEHANRVCLSLSTYKEAWAVLRGFFTSLYAQGLIRADYSKIVPHYTQPQVLPVVYSMEDIQNVIKALPRQTPREKRDYCMVQIAVRLGVRPIDIVRLKVKDIDFNHLAVCFVQKKTGVQNELPLPKDIADCIKDYITNVRPNVDFEEVFVTTTAPHNPVSPRVLSKAVYTSFEKVLGDCNGRRHSPRVLRSSLASSLVNSDVPYQVVSNILGHTSLESIQNYAKIDIENLRLYSLPVQAPTGNFKDYLTGRRNNI